MENRHSRTVVAAVVSFAIGLVVATFAGFRDMLPQLMQGAVVTLEIAAGGAMVAVFAAIVAAVAKMYGPRPIRWLAIGYIEVFRGTSALVQLFWMYFVLPQFGVTLNAYAVGIVALGLNVGAYGAEVIRGALLSVAKGQWEASTALNLTRMQALRRIILPQAFVVMIPPWGNLFIELLKATALVSLITLSDLAFKAQQINQNTLRTAEVFGVVLLIYLLISMVITALMRGLERRAARGLVRGRGAA